MRGCGWSAHLTRYTCSVSQMSFTAYGVEAALASARLCLTPPCPTLAAPHASTLCTSELVNHSIFLRSAVLSTLDSL